MRGFARLRVRLWLRLERFADRRLQSSYDRLVDIEVEALR